MSRIQKLCVLCLALTASRAPAETNLASRFGFTGPEIFPIDTMLGALRVADLDKDGHNDIVLANNSRSKITILWNQTGKTNIGQLSKAGFKREINELPPDARFRVDSIASEKRISSLVVEDLNGDGRPDIAYYGEPKELIALYNQGTNGWGPLKRWSIEDGQLTPNALCAGDLNGDGRTDLVLLAENHLYFLSQQQTGSLDEPRRIPFSGSIRSVQVVDVDGDGRKDLLLVNWEDRNPFRFRLQQPDGQLGPEIYFPFSPIRSYWADSLEPNKKTQMVSIALNSGRAQVSEFTPKPAEPITPNFSQGQFSVLPLNRTEKARRGLIWADVNSDGLPDLIVAEPENGRVAIHFQQKDGSLSAPQAFPSLAGISDIAVSDWDADGKPEVFLLSADEKQVGVAQLDQNQRLPFPTLLPLDGRPLVLAVGVLQDGAKPTLAVIVDLEGKRSLVTRTAEGNSKSQVLSENFKSNPTTLAFHDVDQDGLMDLVVLIPYEKVKILHQVRDGAFEELDVAPPGGAIEQPWLTSADIDGNGKPELLLTQKNFIRAVVLKAEAQTQSGTNKNTWAFSVKEQINGAASNSRLAGAAVLSSGSNSTAGLFLLDAEKKAITVCERDKAGVWQVARNLPLPVSDFTSIKPLALGPGNPNALALTGVNVVGCLLLRGDVWNLTELDGYETPIRDGRLTDVVSGDLDNDGRKDLVFLETAKNYLDLVIFDAAHKLVPANRWQVFEERTFRARTTNLPEPREAVVADVTSDQKNDLIVLVHDRILVYPQE